MTHLFRLGRLAALPRAAHTTRTTLEIPPFERRPCATRRPQGGAAGGVSSFASAYTWYMIVYASLDVGGTEESQRPRHGAAALVTSRELRAPGRNCRETSSLQRLCERRCLSQRRLNALTQNARCQLPLDQTVPTQGSHSEGDHCSLLLSGPPAAHTQSLSAARRSAL